MAVQKGRQGYFAIVNQTTRLTPIATPNKFYAYKELTAELKQEYMDNDSAFGRREAISDRYDLERMAEGNATMLLDADYLADWLRYIYGQATSVQDATTGAYTHTFLNPLNSAEIPLFTGYHTKGDAGNKRHVSCGLKSLEIDISEKGEPTLKIEWIALDEENVASQPTITLVKLNRVLLGKVLTCVTADTVALLGSGTTLKIKKLNIKFDNGTMYDDSYNAGINNDVLGNGWKAEVSFSALIRSNDLYNVFKSNFKRAFRFDLNALFLPTIGTSSLRPRLTIDIAPSTVELTHSLALDEFISFDAKIVPELSLTDNFSIRTIVQNGTATLI